MGTHPIFESDFDCLTESSGEVIMEDPVKPIEEELVYLRDEFAATKEVRDEHSKMSALYHQLQSKCKAEMTRHKRKFRGLKQDIQNIPKSQHDDQIRELDREIKDYVRPSLFFSVNINAS